MTAGLPVVRRVAFCWMCDSDLCPARGASDRYAVDRVWELLATAPRAQLPSSRAGRTRQERDRETWTRFAELLVRGECFERRVGDRVLLFDEPCCHGEPVAVTFAENDDAGRLTAASEDCYGELGVGRSPRKPFDGSSEKPHSRQTYRVDPSSSTVMPIVTPQAGQIGGRSSSALAFFPSSTHRSA